MYDVFVFFLICSFGVNLRYVKFLIHTAVFTAITVVAACVAFGSERDGRFQIVGSSFFGSANDLAIGLVANIGLLSLLLSKKRLYLRVIGILGILLSGFYLLRTGSRGGFVAALTLLAVSFFSAKNKLNVVLMLIPLLLVLPLVKRDALMRLVMIYKNPEQTQIRSDEEGGAIASQMSRQRLLRMSIELTAKHPLFGVGPGQFIEATSGADQRHGRHSPALGTHNTYTQVSSECGVIVFLCFIGALFISLRRMWKLYKKTRNHPQLREISQLAYALVLGLVGFCSVAFFHHVAYSAYAFQLTGLATVLAQVAEPMLAEQRA
jgi:O-antigen ligase